MSFLIQNRGNSTEYAYVNVIRYTSVERKNQILQMIRQTSMQVVRLVFSRLVSVIDKVGNGECCIV